MRKNELLNSSTSDNLNKSLIFPITIITMILLIGSCVFSYSEGWSLFDSFYYSVVVCSSVGYGDFIPNSLFGRIFSCFYMIIGSMIFILMVTLPISFNQIIK